MPTKKPKLRSIVLCEDIRREQGGKHTLIGVYTRKIKVLPGTPSLPQICLYAEFENTDNVELAHIEVLGPANASILKTHESRIEGEDVTVSLKIRDMEILGAGKYQFNCHLDDSKTTITLHIEFGEPTAEDLQ